MKRVFLLLLACCLLIAPADAAGGSGTAADPYIIQTATELQSIQNNLAAYYKLANDINLQGVFTPIGSTSSPFIGSFDGAGYTISNLVISSSTQSTGFFRCLSSGATVKNTIFQDCSVSSTSSLCGVVIGSIQMSSSAHDTAVISNVDCVRCSVSSSGSSIVGCLVGVIQSSAVVEITGCDVSYSDAYAHVNNVGCLVGCCTGALSVEITSSNVLYSHARARTSAVGCLMGGCDSSSSLVIDSSTAQDSIAECTLGPNIGCLVGQCVIASSMTALNCNVLNCLVKGTNYVAGIVGLCDASGSVVTAQTCTVSGCTIVATGDYAGGVVGRCTSGSTGTISDCSVTDSTIIASGYAAGICPAYS